jgi:hypothetical protein
MITWLPTPTMTWFAHAVSSKSIWINQKAEPRARMQQRCSAALFHHTLKASVIWETFARRGIRAAR